MHGEIIEFKPEHMAVLTPREPESWFVNKDTLLAVAGRFPTYTWTVDGIPACYFGIIPMWDGVAECWMVPSDLIAKYPVAFYKGSKQVFDEFVDFYKLERLQITCAVVNQMSKKWLERLGFKKEGTLVKYANGQDFYAMARII